MYKVKAHDNDTKTIAKKDIVPLGGIPKLGDQIIAYWTDDRRYAYTGLFAMKNGKECFIQYKDGDEAWIPTNNVHKFQPLA